MAQNIYIYIHLAPAPRTNSRSPLQITDFNVVKCQRENEVKARMAYFSASGCSVTWNVPPFMFSRLRDSIDRVANCYKCPRHGHVLEL